MGVLLFGAAVFIYRMIYKWLFAKPLASYNQKRIIVTGASSGIGVEIAKQYANMNCKVAIVARRREQLEQTRTEILAECKSTGESDVMVVVADLTKEQDCRSMVEQVVEKWGGIDICVWNAGAGSLVEFAKLKDFKVFHDNMNINFFSNVYCTSFALPYLKQTKGSIVVVSSLAGKFGTALRTSYSASKHALHGFFNSLRNEAPEIQVTLICPGFVQTEFHAKATTTTGKPLERESTHFMTPKQCAEHIIESERLGEREVLLGLKAKVGNYLMPFIPRFIDYMSNKTAVASVKKDQ
ncbi:short-chain dehydrogenase/reductase family protein [Heterostelium album PN500]|uniref:Short-chain dehydrogenase/reductase family protein n=1 Tax=Heterostelium pallidum (strain ATCC 26659 / Pp 5 / PN500) TaxID=670386 RepID=D3B9I0_HETP5|nr:short-chain dehydrogenase/reductase family protein [Heterostelium album PN500]EFA81892.1 short-chain dehydrogenase/reductase family protein [Heterostelium album PN500]|eukprot:XP_020434009.1 short-chain dehydrogenase/reductase family protein [Heterostelium album PN500]